MSLITEQIAFLELLLFIVGALLFVGIGSLVSTWLRPHKPNEAKNSSYESGEATMGTAWGPFNARFYGISLVFMLFEVETILLFPWAMVWINPALNQATNDFWAFYMAFLGTIFILLLSIGLAYAWAQGHLTWSQPPPSHADLLTKVPQKYYDHINRYYDSMQAPGQ